MKKILCLICLFASLLCLGACNLLEEFFSNITDDLFGDNNQQQFDYLFEVFPAAESFEEITSTIIINNSEVRNVYKETSGKGYVFISAAKENIMKDNAVVTVGVNNDGVIIIASYIRQPNGKEEYENIINYLKENNINYQEYKSLDSFDILIEIK